MKDFLVMENITKVYDNGVMANDNVCFSAEKGEIHAICGENGAGKSTLMKLLFGVEQPNQGRIIIRGEEVKLTSPLKAIEMGIGMVYQHFVLVPSLTIAENVMLGIEPKKGILFDKDKAVELTRAICEKYNFDIDPLAKIEDISVGVKQKVEIIKALIRGAEILILDEPTAVLTPQETKELFEQLKLLREAGHTIIFISHKLNEVKYLCDRVTIIRHGRTMGTHNVADVTEADISRLMVGADVELTISKTEAKPKDAVLRVKNLVTYNELGKKTLNGVSFTVREGEILGIAGVEGNGQRALINMITGFGEGGSGEVSINGKDIRSLNIKQLRQEGLVHVPEDRNVMGVAKNMSIRENLIADKINLPKYNKKLTLNDDAIDEDTQQWIKDFDVVCSGSEQPVGMLSGGNVQKVVVARELTSYTKLIVCDQPTRGIDVGATEFIRKRLVQKRDEGNAVLLVSADLGEVMNLSDKLIVMYGGEIVAYFPDVTDITEEDLGFYMLGIKKMTAEEIGGAYVE
ncbi:MAG: ABC transporter ATP-binding protein [Clostridia bacterium]|nr:ABC transporter ATP-binding protein [Clostridia bacterium]